MTYELNIIPPAAIPVRIFASVRDLRIQPESARRARIGYTTRAIIGNATLKSPTEKMIARAFWRIPLQERVSERSHGIDWRANELDPFQYSYAGIERYTALNTPMSARTRMMRYLRIGKKDKKIKTPTIRESSEKVYFKKTLRYRLDWGTCARAKL